MRQRLLLLFTLIVLFGCNRNECKIPDEIADIDVDVAAERLEKEFFQLKTKEDVVNFLNRHPLFANKYLHRRQYPQDSILVNKLHYLATVEGIRPLVHEADTAFKDFKPFEEQLETAFKHIKYFYPDFVVPKVQTFVSGFQEQDLFVTDSLLVFGLDYFIGDSATYRPDTYEYILSRYRKPYMVPSAMLLQSNKYNKTDILNKTMLAEMVYLGKSYYFVERVLPCVPDSVIIGYTDQQIADVQYNEGTIWAHFIEKELLYDNNHFKIRKYLDERPNVPEIDKNAPGRIGAWVGWQIVRKYMEQNPDVTLPQLMAETDVQKIFNQSKYKPKKNK
ncbi:MAG: gliding motility lipoprotein GldB [Hymenobacteraceae bacterium]|nr:gliding motility lipoprotein GldB [Hymenobacteraceae bacterium]MDX5394710.1 gliding motility lipoprotein GldB [Hymenobacteraceae bacterium]MDX5444388.1 gliding motility lipoprotein GldB [Hymenobacteraceae bacterium]MDX5510743.1 gliding motility lipoprotein GldB [Hymenobacteraceae bacterium]